MSETTSPTPAAASEPASTAGDQAPMPAPAPEPARAAAAPTPLPQGLADQVKPQATDATALRARVLAPWSLHAEPPEGHNMTPKSKPALSASLTPNAR